MKLMNQRDASERELIDCQTMFGGGRGAGVSTLRDSTVKSLVIAVLLTQKKEN